MKSRLFTKKKQLSSSINPACFLCLNGRDVTSAFVSDHHPVIHDGVLFWNIMMQGKKRQARLSAGFNNGFGLVETEKEYKRRLKKVALVIAEICHDYKQIEAIALCEGPIHSDHMNVLSKTLKKFSFMKKFFLNTAANYVRENNEFFTPQVRGFPNWGLLMLADRKYTVTAIQCDHFEHSNIFPKLANRFQLWRLEQEGQHKYLALGHFPFGGDEHATNQQQLSSHAVKYSELINKMINDYADERLILCADFNFNPYLIGKWQHRFADQVTHHNSIVLVTENATVAPVLKTVTVDGVLLSHKEKQQYFARKFYPGLFKRLGMEHQLSLDVERVASIKKVQALNKV